MTLRHGADEEDIALDPSLQYTFNYTDHRNTCWTIFADYGNVSGIL